MTIEVMKTIAAENNGTIPAGMAMTMTDLEVRRAIKHGYLKEDLKKVQSLKPKKNPRKEFEEGAKQAEKKEELPAPVASGTVSTFSKEQKATYSRLDGLIYDRMNDMKKSSFDIAFALHSIYENGYYKIGGFKNIYEYASKRYGIARGTTNNFINLVERFADLKNQESLELKPEFADYSSTQLICMLGHTDDELKEKNITPSMSSRDIKKALKDSGNGSKGESVNTLNGGKSASKNSGTGSDTEDEESGNESGLNKIRANIVLELTKESFSGFPDFGSADTDTCVMEVLAGKAKVIAKLLLSGHRIQILDILP